jgi:hypothetical protein
MKSEVIGFRLAAFFGSVDVDRFLLNNASTTANVLESNDELQRKGNS